MSEQLRNDGPVAVAGKPKHWKLTADQYQRMGEAGIFRKEDRVELLEGELYEMTPIGSWHGGNWAALNMTFVSALGSRAIVWGQSSLLLAPHSEPEPDLLLLRYRSDFYRSALPGPTDVLLLVEVADTSLSYDRDLKLPLYARAGIPEVWIVNRKDARIEVYREPEGDGYRTVSLHQRGSAVASLAFPDLTIQVEAILG